MHIIHVPACSYLYICIIFMWLHAYKCMCICEFVRMLFITKIIFVVLLFFSNQMEMLCIKTCMLHSICMYCNLGNFQG